MMYLVGGGGSLRDRSAQFGTMLSPRTRGLRPLREGRRWAADNDAFHGRFEAAQFTAHLTRLTPFQSTCLFVVSPDVVCDPAATATLFQEWGPRIRDLGYPVAWVAQNSARPDDIPDCDCVFIGGDTAWKLSSDAFDICVAAKQRGLWLHIGRVNSERRTLLAARMGADSVDGTYTAYTGHDAGLSTIGGWLTAAQQARAQRRLL